MKNEFNGSDISFLHSPVDDVCIATTSHSMIMSVQPMDIREPIVHWEEFNWNETDLSLEVWQEIFKFAEYQQEKNGGLFND